MKHTLLALCMLIAVFSNVKADYTITWTPPTENTDGSPLTDLAGYDLWCIPEANTYGTPMVIDDPQQTSYFKFWPSPAGDWKCKMRAFNEGGQRSDDSPEIFFTLFDVDGDGNPEVVKPGAPDPDDPDAIVPTRVNSLEITRKGYWVIEGPDGELLQKADGSTRQVTSRDEAYEYITQDGRDGTFTILPPTYEVEWQ